MKRWGQRRSRRRYRVPFICVTMGINCTAPSRTVIGWIGFHLASQSPTHGFFLSHVPSSHFYFTWKIEILDALIKHFKCNFILFFNAPHFTVSCFGAYLLSTQKIYFMANKFYQQTTKFSQNWAQRKRNALQKVNQEILRHRSALQKGRG